MSISLKTSTGMSNQISKPKPKHPWPSLIRKKLISLNHGRMQGRLFFGLGPWIEEDVFYVELRWRNDNGDEFPYEVSKPFRQMRDAMLNMEKHEEVLSKIQKIKRAAEN